MFHQVDIAASNHGMTLVDGKGNDPDTLGKRMVYVMDSNVFPFHQAEVCKYCLVYREIELGVCRITHSLSRHDLPSSLFILRLTQKHIRSSISQ